MQQRATARLAMLAIAVLVLFGTADARATGLGEYPEIGAEAMAYYETRLEDWADGPVDYLLLDEERQIWDSLDDDEARRAFVEWFWARRDDDPRDLRNPLKIEFYRRVARANQRFHGLPRGWKSDRGRVLVTLGHPDGIRNALGGRADTQVWTYHTTKRDRPFGSASGEMTVLFARIRGSDYDIAGGFAGLGSYPYYLQQAFEYTRQASIVDPFLELDPR